jgi:hypothetical protein
VLARLHQDRCGRAAWRRFAERVRAFVERLVTWARGSPIARRTPIAEVIVRFARTRSGR